MLRADGGVHILAGEQDLGHGAVVLGKEFIVDVHHHALAHGGGGLLHPQLGGAGVQPQFLGADADGARGNQHHLIAHTLQVGEHPGQALHILKIETACLTGQGGSTHLDHQSAYVIFALQSVHPPNHSRVCEHHTTVF